MALWKKIRGFTLPILCLAMGGALLVYPKIAAQGVRQGLLLCVNVMVPSLFPFMTLCFYLLYAEGYRRMERRMAPVAKALFRQPGCGLPVVLFGLVGGFPTGAKLAVKLCQKGQLTTAQARRLMTFCVNPGPAFLIGAVGSAMLGSKKAGLLLFLSLSLSSLIMGVLSRFLKDDGEASAPVQTMQPDYRKPLNRAVTDATAAIAGVCAWVVLFSCLLSFLSLLPQGSGTLRRFLQCSLEVSDGCRALAEAGVPLPVIALTVGWGGLCVHAQITDCLEAVAMPRKLFFVSRLLHGGLSALLCSWLVRLFPVTVSTQAGQAPIVRPWNVSIPAAAATLFMTGLLILDLDKPHKIE